MEKSNTFRQVLKLATVAALAAIAPASAFGQQTQQVVAKVQTSEEIQPSNSVNEISVHVVDQDIGEFIREAARREGYEVTVSRKVRGRIQRMTLPLDVEQIMEQLSPQFNLKWHYQQKHIFISTGQENTTRLVYLGVMDMNELTTAMNTAGIKSNMFEMSYVEDSNSVLVNGSASYIAGIELLADAYNKNSTNRKSNVRIIRFGRVGS